MQKILLFLAVMIFGNLHAQNIGINSDGSTPNNSAMLDISSQNKGLLIPRISIDSIGDKSEISAPANSLLIFNTNNSTANGLKGRGYYYNSGTTTLPV